MVIYSVCMIICLFIKSGLDYNIISLSVCLCVCVCVWGGGGWVLFNPPAMALYNDAFTIFIPAAPCITTSVELYF